MHVKYSLEETENQASNFEKRNLTAPFLLHSWW